MLEMEVPLDGLRDSRNILDVIAVHQRWRFL